MAEGMKSEHVYIFRKRATTGGQAVWRDGTILILSLRNDMTSKVFL